MGNVHAEITIRNIEDMGKARKGLIDEEAIRFKNLIQIVQAE